MDFGNLLRLVAFDWPLFLVVLALAAFYTIITKAIQFSRAGLIARETLGAIRERNLGSSGQITAFQATMIAMCGTVGTGSIIGVTAGILLGGPGAVLWLWIFALLSMALKYGEATLSVHFRRVYTDGSTFGGPFVYIARGLGGRIGAAIGGLFALLAILAAFGVGNLAQVSGAATTLDASFNVPSVIWSFALSVLVLLVIGGGPKRIARTAQILFPVMVVLYAVLALALMLKNITGLGGAFVSIFSNALSFQAAGAGASHTDCKPSSRRLRTRVVRLERRSGRFEHRARAGASGSSGAARILGCRRSLRGARRLEPDRAGDAERAVTVAEQH
ncbi:MAG: sodium:alanine symporter family protein [Pleurocapsa sp. SU_196_0]|nr:sodium:alanine symporter family protein [Pleurocapsa sp. SU_196_0]